MERITSTPPPELCADAAEDNARILSQLVGNKDRPVGYENKHDIKKKEINPTIHSI